MLCAGVSGGWNDSGRGDGSVVAGAVSESVKIGSFCLKARLQGCCVVGGGRGASESPDVLVSVLTTAPCGPLGTHVGDAPASQPPRGAGAGGMKAPEQWQGEGIGSRRALFGESEARCSTPSWHWRSRRAKESYFPFQGS